MNDWSQGNKQINFILQISKLFAQGRKHLWCALRMANVGNFFLPSLLYNKIDLSGHIKLSKFVKAIIKIRGLVIFKLNVQKFMFSTVCSSSVVAKPNVIARFGIFESSWFFAVENEWLRVRQQTVLYHDRG